MFGLSNNVTTKKARKVVPFIYFCFKEKHLEVELQLWICDVAIFWITC